MNLEITSMIYMLMELNNNSVMSGLSVQAVHLNLIIRRYKNAIYRKRQNNAKGNIGVLYSKYKILSLAIMLVVLVFGICLFIQNSGSAITGGNGSFGYSDFESNVVSKDSEKIIENSSFKGIFVYGPYANIKAGKYKGTINYNSTVSVKYELTSGFGANLISTGTLLPNRSSEEFNFNVPTDVNDKSLELRVYYDGNGKLEFNSFEYKGAGVSSNYIVPIIALLLCLGCSIFRLNGKRGYLTQLYLYFFMCLE